MPPPTLQVTPQITESFGAPIKQYAGQKQVTQAVRVQVPGKHFTGLSASEQKLDYWVSAMEFRERHAFERNLKAWGSAHTGPGIRFVSEDDAVDEPDHHGFWTTLSLWNKWRDQTYRDNRDAELLYLAMAQIIDRYNIKFHGSPAGAAPPLPPPHPPPHRPPHRPSQLPLPLRRLMPKSALIPPLCMIVLFHLNTTISP